MVLSCHTRQSQTLYNVPLCRYLRGPRQFVTELNVSFYNRTHNTQCHISPLQLHVLSNTFYNWNDQYIHTCTYHQSPLNVILLSHFNGRATVLLNSNWATTQVQWCMIFSWKEITQVSENHTCPVAFQILSTTEGSQYFQTCQIYALIYLSI